MSAPKSVGRSWGRTSLLVLSVVGIVFALLPLRDGFSPATSALSKSPPGGLKKNAAPTSLPMEIGKNSVAPDLEQLVTATANPSQARETCKQILATDPTNELALFGLTSFIQNDEQVLETTRWFEALLSRYPQSSAIAKAAADFFDTQGNEALAMKLLIRLKRDPTQSLYAHTELARLYEKRGRLKEAAAELTQAIYRLETGELSVAEEETLGRRQLLLAQMLLNDGNRTEAGRMTAEARRHIKDEAQFQTMDTLLEEEE